MVPLKENIEENSVISVLYICVTLAFCTLWSDNVFAGQAKGFNHTGLKLPRFVSLATDEANIRTGPGLKYPIRWHFNKENLPVEIVGEFDVWREIRDFDGDGGWVHKSLLSSRRTIIVKDQIRTLYRKPDKDTKPVVKLEPNVVSKLEHCNDKWCYVTVAGYKGWVERPYIWGVYDQEVVD